MHRPGIIGARPHHGGGGYVGPLDIVPGAVVAYSQRAMSSALRGSPVYTILESGGDTTQSFSSDALTGEVDAAAITAFINGASGFVSPWNDQSGNGCDLSQLNDDPLNSAEWSANVNGGKPALISHLGNDTSLVNVSGFSLTNGALSFFWVARDGAAFFNNDGIGLLNIQTGNSGGDNACDLDQADADLVNRAGGTFAYSASFGDWRLFDGAWEFGSKNLKANGANLSATSSTDAGGTVGEITAAFVDLDLSTGSIRSAIQEFILYPTLLSDANRLAIRQNIAAYYGITLL